MKCMDCHGKINGGWVELEDAAEPLINFSGCCTPLSFEQLRKLEKPRPPG